MTSETQEMKSYIGKFETGHSIMTLYEKFFELHRANPGSNLETMGGVGHNDGAFSYQVRREEVSIRKGAVSPMTIEARVTLDSALFASLKRLGNLP